MERRLSKYYPTMQDVQLNMKFNTVLFVDRYIMLGLFPNNLSFQDIADLLLYQCIKAEVFFLSANVTFYNKGEGDSNQRL